VDALFVVLEEFFSTVAAVADVVLVGDDDVVGMVVAVVVATLIVTVVVVAAVLADLDWSKSISIALSLVSDFSCFRFFVFLWPLKSLLLPLAPLPLPPPLVHHSVSIDTVVSTSPSSSSSSLLSASSCLFEVDRFDGLDGVVGVGKDAASVL